MFALLLCAAGAAEPSPWGPWEVKYRDGHPDRVSYLYRAFYWETDSIAEDGSPAGRLKVQYLVEHPTTIGKGRTVLYDPYRREYWAAVEGGKIYPFPPDPLPTARPAWWVPGFTEIQVPGTGIVITVPEGNK
jgi:hypothetical protein